MYYFRVMYKFFCCCMLDSSFCLRYSLLHAHNFLSAYLFPCHIIKYSCQLFCSTTLKQCRVGACTHFHLHFTRSIYNRLFRWFLLLRILDWHIAVKDPVFGWMRFNSKLTCEAQIAIRGLFH